MDGSASGASPTAAWSGRHTAPKGRCSQRLFPRQATGWHAAARIRRGIDRGAARVAFPQRIVFLTRVLDLLPARIGDALLRETRARIDDPT